MIRKAGTPKNERQPVILAMGPYFGHAGQGPPGTDPTREAVPNAYYEELISEGKIFERGYTLVQADLRGFGGSEGCNDFGGKGEQADVKAAVEWAAAQRWSNGKVGQFGKSYDGWTPVMGLATKPKGLAASVIQAPVVSGYRALYMNGVHYNAGWYITPGLYQAADLQPPSVFDSPEYFQHAALGTNPACYALNIGLQTALMDPDDALGFWKERDIIAAASESSVPTLWEHGLVDANAKSDNFLDVYSKLRGPKRVWTGQWEHDRPTKELIGRKGFYEESVRWFDRWLKGLGPAEAPIENDPGAEVQDGGTHTWRAEPSWPPQDARPFALAVNPGTHVQTIGNSASGGGPNGLGAGTTGQGIWSVSPVLPHHVHLAGTPRLALDVTTSAPRANLFAVLYDIDAAGKAQVLTRGAYAVRSSGNVAFDLYPQDWTFLAGHRIALLMATSDDEWFQPVPIPLPVEIEGGALSLPFLTYTRSATLPGKGTSAESTRLAPFAVDAATLAAGAAKFALPPALVEPAAAALPVTQTPAVRKQPKLSVTLRRTGVRRLVASGRGPAGLKLRVRIVRRGKTVATRRVTIPASRRWRATFRVRGTGLRAVVSARVAGTSLRVTSRGSR